MHTRPYIYMCVCVCVYMCVCVRRLFHLSLVDKIGRKQQNVYSFTRKTQTAASYYVITFDVIAFLSLSYTLNLDVSLWGYSPREMG